MNMWAGRGVLKLMRVRTYILLLSVILTSLSPLCRGDRRSVKSAITPPSSGGGGLIRSPNPVDLSGNLIVTGNVAGGRHFRGVVPYNAISDFGGTLGSTTLDSFLRRSGGSGSFGHYSGTVRPYYSPTGTVTYIPLGRRNVYSPSGIKTGNTLSKGLTLSPPPRQQAGISSTSAPFDMQFRPISIGRPELKKLLTAGVEPGVEQQSSYRVKEGRQGKKIEYKYEEVKERIEQTSVGDISRGADVYEQMKKEIEEFRRNYEL
ncbi:MAG: hypothetical protein ACYSW6_06310, partial [Planctomycetota bacterium]